MQEVQREMEKEEAALIQKNVERLVRHGWVICQEWEPIPGRPEFGKGDILATRKHCILAVECKHINHTNRTSTCRAVCKKVRDQAILYASFAKIKNPSKRVRGCWSTNETKEYTSDIMYDDAMETIAEYLKKTYLIYRLDKSDKKCFESYLKKH
jgi:hypothetical protein